MPPSSERYRLQTRVKLEPILPGTVYLAPTP